MPVLRKPTKRTYELVCVHEKKLCKISSVFFLPATAFRVLFDRSFVTSAVRARSLVSVSTLISTGILFETGPEVMSAWYTAGRALC